MDYAENHEQLHGLPAFDFPSPDQKRELPEPETVAWRLSHDPYGDSDSDGGYAGRFQRFLDTVDTSRVRALIFGMWGETYVDDSSAVIEPLVAAKDRFPALDAVFIGDIDAEQAEISWIEQSDVTPVLDAFPRLRELKIRGGMKLSFPAVTHEHLHTLCFESGGLPGAAVRGVCDSELPALERLEMWLGVSEYGGDATVADLGGLLSGGRFPALRHLGLQNSEIQDEIATAVAAAPIVAQLTSLSLSMGVLTDTGAEALLEGQPLTHLKTLDLHYNFFSEAMEERLREALEPSGVELDLSEKGDEDEEEDDREVQVWRYTAVSE
ncbi:STM4015 family protein [Streptomyces sp. ME19-01-6]|uniref:STM4015 family protein n=1 Tax=Streptomyces sp. ME19-01-6 TaxID=3028686 RepID=UPI0029B4755A|nr:STM4015 family protein [Streptomyces sp. ME19-01-6]MDX3228476.1 STM4015 family protein [Streptomyces sp. ME19-01-6]